MSAQKIVQFEAYVNGYDHRCFLYKPDKPCDSLNLKLPSGKLASKDDIICYEAEYKDGVDVTLYDRSGISVCVDSNGQLYSRDSYSQGKPYYLNIHIDKLLQGRNNIVIEADDYDYDSLVLRAIPLDKYRLGQKNSKNANHVAIYYDNFTYPAKGELSPTLLNDLYSGTQIIPEDGKVSDKFTLILPVSKVNIPGTWSLYIYDLSGNILKMYTGLTQAENVIYRENITTGTYKYAVYFSRSFEIKKGMIYFKEPPKPE